MKHFTLIEFQHSAKAHALGIDNTMPKDASANAVRLIEQILDPLRTAYAQPIYINSGYRSPALNKAVGGAKNSHHILGMAADITAGNKASNRRLYQLILDLNLPFTQLINEHDFTWIHVSLDPNRVIRQTLSIK